MMYTFNRRYVYFECSKEEFTLYSNESIKLFFVN